MEHGPSLAKPEKEHQTSCDAAGSLTNARAFREFLRVQGVPLFQSPRNAFVLCGVGSVNMRQEKLLGSRLEQRSGQRFPAHFCQDFPVLTEYDAKRLLKAYAFPSQGSLCGSLRSQARSEELDTRALKVMSGDILHKTERVVALTPQRESVENADGSPRTCAHLCSPCVRTSRVFSFGMSGKT
jgi:acyl-CoA synthetase (NDP forming)